MKSEKKAKWIWYKNDFEIYTFHKLSKRRYERNNLIYPCWAMDRPEYQVLFYSEYDVPEDTSFKVISNGRLVVNINESPWNVAESKGEIKLKKGKGIIRIYCFDENEFPSIFIDSPYIKTDENWLVRCIDPVSYKASCSDMFDSENKKPAEYRLPTQKLNYKSKKKVGSGICYDFGKEIVAKPVVTTNKDCNLKLFYGESEEEAIDYENSEVCEELFAKANISVDARECVGFRYLYIKNAEHVKDVYVRNEIYEHSFTPSFVSDDKELNEIYKTAIYTLELTSREFFIDGPKRDRWVWAGDVLQSLWFDFYSFFDKEIVKRTLSAIIGKQEIKSNVSGILDYNFYYILSVYYYYVYTGDKEFIEQIYPRLESLMRFIFDKPTMDGFLMSESNEWLFIDWTDIKDFDVINHKNPVGIIQILYFSALRIMKDFAELLGKDGSVYESKLDGLRDKIDKVFFNENGYGFKHDPSGECRAKYGNIAAVLFDYASKEQKKVIEESVFDNELYEIYTPFMKFYEMCTYAELGKIDYVLSYVKEYWGAMIKLGATTFWERFDPEQKGAERYAMYGRKYGKSLCHSWGAGPLYIIGKYVVGLSPYEVGYEKFILNPLYGELHYKSELPLPKGHIKVEYDGKSLTVFSTETDGILKFSDKIKDNLSLPKCKDGYIVKANLKHIIEIKE